MTSSGVHFFTVLSIGISPLLAFAFIGMLWAPCAMAISYTVALRQNRPTFEALLGALIASFCLFFPWILLLAMNLKWEHSSTLLDIAYKIVYIIWGLFSIGILTVIILIWVISLIVSATTGGLFARDLLAHTPFLLFPTIIVGVNAWMWNRSRVKVLRSMSSQQGNWRNESGFIPLIYLEPFLVAYAWSVLTPLIVVGMGWGILQFTFGAS